jgi:sensor domain DACNV-containing protein
MNDEKQNNKRFRLKPFNLVPRPTTRQYGRGAAFKLESGFFDALFDRLQTVRREENERYRKLRLFGSIFTDRFSPETLPDRIHLEKLVEATFWTSLQREEGRPLKFAVNYGASSSSRSEVKFLETRPYDVTALTKLASAVSNQIFGIAVDADKSGELQIWGLNISSDLQIKVIDPGKLIVKFFLSNVAAISGDQSLLLRPPVLPFTASLFWRKFASEADTQYSPWSDTRVRVISAILKAMREFGHGGTLVLLPERSGVEVIKTLEAYDSAAPSETLSEVVNEINEAKDSQSTHVSALENYLDYLAEAAAALTCVDGATLLTYDLKILGFGCMFKWNPADSSGITLQVQDPLDHEDYMKTLPLDKLGHSRHQSAAQFINEHRDAIAFVASQDGNVTAFVWEEWGDEKRFSSLVAYTRLELTMF